MIAGGEKTGKRITGQCFDPAQLPQAYPECLPEEVVLPEDTPGVCEGGLDPSPGANSGGVCDSPMDEFCASSMPAPESGGEKIGHPLFAVLPETEEPKPEWYEKLPGPGIVRAEADRKALILDLDTNLKEMPDYIRRRPIHKKLLQTAARLWRDPDPKGVQEFERSVMALEDEVWTRTDKIALRGEEINRMNPAERRLLVRDLRRRLEKLRRLPDADLHVFIRNFGSAEGGDRVVDLIGEAEKIQPDPDPRALQIFERRVNYLESYGRLLEELDKMLLKLPAPEELDGDPVFKLTAAGDRSWADKIKDTLRFMASARVSDRSLPDPKHIKNTLPGARDAKFERVIADPNMARHPENFHELARRIEDHEFMLADSRFKEFFDVFEARIEMTHAAGDALDGGTKARRNIVRLKLGVRRLDRILLRLTPPKGTDGVAVTAAEFQNLCDELKKSAGEIFDELGAEPRVVFRLGEENIEVHTKTPAGAFEMISDIVEDSATPDYNAEKDRIITILGNIPKSYGLSDTKAGGGFLLEGEGLELLRGIVKDISHYENVRLGRWLKGQTDGLDEDSQERLEAALVLAADIVEGKKNTGPGAVEKGKEIVGLLAKNPDLLYRVESSLSADNFNGYAKILDSLKFAPGQRTAVVTYGSYKELGSAFREEAERLERGILANVSENGRRGFETMFKNELRRVAIRFAEFPEDGASEPAEVEIGSAGAGLIRDDILTLVRFESELLRLMMRREEERLRSLGAAKEDIDVFESRIEKIFSAAGEQRFDELAERIGAINRAFENLEFKLAVERTRDIFNRTENVKKLVMAAEVFGLGEVNEEGFALASRTLESVLGYLDRGQDDKARTLYAAFVSSSLHVELAEVLQRAEKVALVDELSVTMAVSIVVVMSAGFLSELAPVWLAGYIGKASKIKRLGLAFTGGAAFDNAERAIGHVALGRSYFEAEDPSEWANELASGTLNMTAMFGTIGFATRASVAGLNVLARTKPAAALLLRYPFPFVVETGALGAYNGTAGYAHIAMGQGYYDFEQAGAQLALSVSPAELAKTGMFLGGLKGGRRLASPLSPIGGSVRAAIEGHHRQRLDLMDSETERLLGERKEEWAPAELDEIDRKLAKIQDLRILALERGFITDAEMDAMPVVTEKDRARKEDAERGQKFLRLEIARQRQVQENTSSLVPEAVAELELRDEPVAVADSAPETGPLPIEVIVMSAGELPGRPEPKGGVAGDGDTTGRIKRVLSGQGSAGPHNKPFGSTGPTDRLPFGRDRKPTVLDIPQEVLPVAKWDNHYKLELGRDADDVVDPSNAASANIGMRGEQADGFVVVNHGGYKYIIVIDGIGGTSDGGKRAREIVERAMEWALENGSGVLDAIHLADSAVARDILGRHRARLIDNPKNNTSALLTAVKISSDGTVESWTIGKCVGDPVSIALSPPDEAGEREFLGWSHKWGLAEHAERSLASCGNVPKESIAHHRAKLLGGPDEFLDPDYVKIENVPAGSRVYNISDGLNFGTPELLIRLEKELEERLGRRATDEEMRQAAVLDNEIGKEFLELPTDELRLTYEALFLAWKEAYKRVYGREPAEGEGPLDIYMRHKGQWLLSNGVIVNSGEPPSRYSKDNYTIVVSTIGFGT